MPTLLNCNGFKFFFYANEHFPAHVHVIKGGAWAKLEIRNQKVVYSSFKAKELQECLKILSLNKKMFMEKWNEWFQRKNNPCG